jgi:DNA-binding transcriptional LysR family regulator
LTDLSLTILPETTDDAPAVERLHARTFGPGRFAKSAYRLREKVPHRLELSFTARVGTLLVGSVRLSPIRVGKCKALLLGPLTAPEVSNRVLCEYPVGFLASPSLGLGNRQLTVHDLAKFPIITFPRKTAPYEIVRSLFNQPDLPPIRLHASASLATVIHMAIEGLGIAVIPTAIVESEMADKRLQLLSTNLQLPQLTFSASWLASPDTVAVERVAELAANLAQGGVIVDAPRQSGH